MHPSCKPGCSRQDFFSEIAACVFDCDYDHLFLCLVDAVDNGIVFYKQLTISFVRIVSNTAGRALIWHLFQTKNACFNLINKIVRSSQF